MYEYLRNLISITNASSINDNFVNVPFLRSSNNTRSNMCHGLLADVGGVYVSLLWPSIARSREPIQRYQIAINRMCPNRQSTRHPAPLFDIPNRRESGRLPQIANHFPCKHICSLAAGLGLSMRPILHWCYETTFLVVRDTFVIHRIFIGFL